MKRILLVLATMAAAVLVASGVALAPPLPHAGKITINDATFDESTLVTTPGTGSPYPSEITVSGLGSTIDDVNLQIRGLSHTYPCDVDMLLVGPEGQNAIVMADVGYYFSVKSKTLILDDQAATALPDADPLTRGTFQPTNSSACDSGDNFPSPAPTPSGGSVLSVFNGTDPNGTWKLYVVDDAQGDIGQLRGWALEITAT
jgi:subtilisin-like proprotein convertase family protein